MGNYTMENEKMSVTIADHGAELISIFDKENQREIIWQADPSFWNRHAPILFPNVGKHYGGAYSYQGNKYPTGQHGFARDKEFKRVEEKEFQVTHRLTADEETKKIYPFDFQLEVTQKLAENRLTVQWKVTNPGENMMYFTIGGHPAFNVQVLPNTRFDDYFLCFEENVEKLSYVLLDTNSGTAIVEKEWPMALHNHTFRLRKDMFDKDALVFDGGQISWAGLALPDGSPYVAVESRDFPNFGIWSKPGAPYVCLEPWCGRTDNCGFDQDISEKPGINVLESGGIFEKSYDIIVY
ncbi:MAG: aldose 1-epimerase family protein [Clostridiales bacterium]|nr:aldose 1-epimerase family protein [Clostridiales bacterium]